MTKAKHTKTIVILLVAAIVIACVAYIFVNALNNLEEGQTEVSRQQLEDSVRRAALSSYATDGVYPPNLEYLQNYYGLQIDESRYAVFYDIFAENLMPDITVIDITED